MSQRYKTPARVVVEATFIGVAFLLMGLMLFAAVAARAVAVLS
jgi:hypothetical protein